MKYGKQITEEICKYLEQGMSQKDSCDLASIHVDTFHEWMKKPAFSEAIKKAELKCKQRNIGLIQRAAITTWQAAAWWLERRCSDEFALKTKLEHSGKIGSDETAEERAARRKDVQDFLASVGKI